MPPALVVRLGSTILQYQLRCLDDLSAMPRKHGNWMTLGSADEQKPAPPGTVEAWARSLDHPVGGWYGLKKGLRGRFGNYVPPVMEVLGLAEVEHLRRIIGCAPVSRFARKELPARFPSGLRPPPALEVYPRTVAKTFRARRRTVSRPSRGQSTLREPPPPGRGVGFDKACPRRLKVRLLGSSGTPRKPCENPTRTPNPGFPRRFQWGFLRTPTTERASTRAFRVPSVLKGRTVREAVPGAR